jgi:dTDP-4-amino-4,6-dideoxygalactose transaminase
MPGPGFELIGKEEEKEVLDVLRSKWLFRYGDDSNPRFKKKVRTFEEEVCKAFGVKHALAVSTGTSALLAALAATRVGPGSEVIVPGYTFVASIASVILSRAIPILAEVDESLTLDPEDVERKITPRTKAIMAVHMIGNPCNMDALKAIADKHKLLLIEDVAQAFGGSYKGRRLGTMGTVGATSFNIFKTINAGDGGLLYTDDDELYVRAFGYHDQGHAPGRSGAEIGNRSVIGQDLRMNELTGAVLLAQFRKLDGILERLRALKARFKNRLQGASEIDFRTINDPGECATILTILLPDAGTAASVARELGTVTVSKSGWHVYSNMEHLLNKRTPTEDGCPFNCPLYKGEVEYHQGMLPKTDALLDRAINLTVGVVCDAQGASVGVNLSSTDREVDRAARQVLEAVQKHAG